jgi:hypothetical protein
MSSAIDSRRLIWRAAFISLILVLIAFILTTSNFLGPAVLWENVHWTLATWGMTTLGFLGWQSASGRLRTIRGVMTLGLLSYAIGQILWDIEWVTGSIPFPAPSDIFYLGIAHEYHDRIFGLFNKLSAQTEGTGVGLALVKRIVEFHGGQIWVESDGLNQGSKFCFTLG